jgi:hypothetical protein
VNDLIRELTLLGVIVALLLVARGQVLVARGLRGVAEGQNRLVEGLGRMAAAPAVNPPCVRVNIAGVDIEPRALLQVLEADHHPNLQGLRDVLRRAIDGAPGGIAGLALDPRVLLAALDAHPHPGLAALREVVRQVAESMPRPAADRTMLS